VSLPPRLLVGHRLDTSSPQSSLVGASRQCKWATRPFEGYLMPAAHKPHKDMHLHSHHPPSSSPPSPAHEGSPDLVCSGITMGPFTGLHRASRAACHAKLSEAGGCLRLIWGAHSHVETPALAVMPSPCPAPDQPSPVPQRLTSAITCASNTSMGGLHSVLGGEVSLALHGARGPRDTRWGADAVGHLEH
jgi:hypothetical protein